MVKRKIKQDVVSQKDGETPADSPVWVTGDRVRERQLEWLLPGRIIQGCLTVLEGETSVGKSTFLAALAAAVTTGREWAGRPKGRPESVLWLYAEEDYASMIRPRLKSAGADESRILTPGLDEAGAEKRLYLPASLPLVRQAILERGVKLVIVEPLSSHVGPTCDLNQVNQSRAALDPINRMGLELGATIIVTRGLRKDRTGPRLNHGQGSLAIGDTARCVLVIDRPDLATTRRVLRVVKCGSAGHTPPLEYHLEPTDGAPVVGQLRDLLPSEDDDAADVTDAGERDVRKDAQRMLRLLCAKEWVRVTVIQDAARDAAIGERTLRRAKADLSVRTRQLSDGAGSYHEWGPPEGGFPPEGTPPAGLGHVGRVGSSPRKKAAKTRKNPHGQTHMANGGGGG